MAIFRGLPHPELMRFGVGVRSRFMDELLLEALASKPIATVLSVGCGLDTRPWRLELPPKLRWIEIDFADMLDYKDSLLSAETPRCSRERITADVNDAAQRRGVYAAAGRAPAPSVLIDLGDAGLFNPHSMRAAIDAQLGRSRARPPGNLVGYVRLICSSLGMGHAKAAQAIGRLSGRKFGRILAVGGGSQNRLLCQATADASGLPVDSYSLEGAAVGNIAAQLVALGAVSDHASFRSIYARQLKKTAYLPR